MSLNKETLPRRVDFNLMNQSEFAMSGLLVYVSKNRKEPYLVVWSTLTGGDRCSFVSQIREKKYSRKTS